MFVLDNFRRGLLPRRSLGVIIHVAVTFIVVDVFVVVVVVVIAVVDIVVRTAARATSIGEHVVAVIVHVMLSDIDRVAVGDQTRSIGGDRFRRVHRRHVVKRIRA